MKTQTELFSPLLKKYEKILQRNPQSRVFAPLAEIYRKYAMIDKAMTILKEGIRYNPTYTLGYLGLAQCYYDQGQYRNCHATLRPLVGNNRDNFTLQRLFAKVCEELDLLEEALSTYKHLLYLNPKQQEVGKIVSVLEEKIVQEEGEEFFLREKKLFDSNKLASSPWESMADTDDEEVDEWEQINLKKENPPPSPSKEEGGNQLMNLYDKKIGGKKEAKEEECPSLEMIKRELWTFYDELRARAENT